MNRISRILVSGVLALGGMAGSTAFAATYYFDLSLKNSAGSSSVMQNSCNEYQLAALDANNGSVATTIADSHVMAITLQGITGMIYSGANCTGIGSVSIGAGVNPVNFWFKAGSSAGIGSINATANIATWQSASLPVSIATPAPGAAAACETGSGYLQRPPNVDCSVTLNPGENVQSALSAGYGVVCLNAGTYRLASGLSLGSGQTLFGEPGTVLNGSIIVHPTMTATSSGELYSASVPSVAVGSGVTSLPGYGDCQADYPVCYIPNDVYVDGVLYKKVASLADVTSGTVYLDVAGRRIYLKDDVANDTVEYTVVPTALFLGTDSTVEGLLVEKFAGNAFEPVIAGSKSAVIEGNEVRFAHGAGVMGGALTTHNCVHDIGNQGLETAAGSNGAVFSYNEVSYNNSAGYSWNWQGGGSKFWKSTNVLASYNYAHDNGGPGLWDDTDNTITYEKNLVLNNKSDGIRHEVASGSGPSTIKSNTITNNGWGDADHRTTGCGITINTSPNTVTTGNMLSQNHGGICLIAAGRSDEGIRRYLTNNNTSGNTVDYPAGSFYTGVIPENSPYNNPYAAGNSFTANTYTVSDTDLHWYWNSAPVTYSQWQSYGNH